MKSKEQLPASKVNESPEKKGESRESAVEKTRRRMLMGGIAVALTLMASMGANKAAENKPREMPETITAELDSGITVHEGLDVGLFDTIPGENSSIELPGFEYTIGVKAPDTKSEISVNPESDIQLMEWAQKFDIDPMAVEPRGPEAISSAVDQIEQLKADGWNIDKITIQGFASDESDSRDGENPGFGILDEKNIKLANKRAEAVSEMYKQEIEKSFGSDSQEIESLIEVAEGQEVTDNQLAEQISFLAGEYGMSTEDLVMQFNRDPSSLPADAQELLDGLRQDRFVRIEIEASKEVTNPGEEGIDSIIVVPVFIPIFRRKRQSSAVNPSPEPIQSVPSEKQTIVSTQRQKFSHAPMDIGAVRSGYQRISGHNKDPNTHNGGHSKGSGGRFAAKVHTTHRGNSARKH